MARMSVSAQINSRLNHPVIDADGHWIEFEPTCSTILIASQGPGWLTAFGVKIIWLAQEASRA